MEIIRKPYPFQAFCAGLEASQALGLVPTMGALHDGHRSLIRASRQRDEVTAVSIFVNPTQFGPNEDFAQYPRNEERDLALLDKEGVQVVFIPEAEDIYIPGDATRVEVEGLSARLCGASRPGHFRGVATVVLKLFQLAEPTRAYFGQKDAAQVAIIKRMVEDLFLPMELVVCPIVRERDGLALSSRNAYLSPEERAAAGTISRALRLMGKAYDSGERSARALLVAGSSILEHESRLRLDYLTAVDSNTLQPVTDAGPGTLFAAAAFAGATRLIDNAHIDHDGTFLM